ADELDVEEVVELELPRDPGGDVHQPGVVQSPEVHCETRPHLLARLRVGEHDPTAGTYSVDRPFRAAGELHHERLGALVAEQLDEVFQPQRLRDAWTVLEQLPAAIRARRDD